MAVDALDERFSPDEGSLGDHNSVTLHDSHGHGDGPSPLLGEGSYPLHIAFFQGCEGLPYGEQAREVRDLAERLHEEVRLACVHNHVAGKEQLLRVLPLSVDLLLRLVLGGKALPPPAQLAPRDL